MFQAGRRDRPVGRWPSRALTGSHAHAHSRLEKKETPPKKALPPPPTRLVTLNEKSVPRSKSRRNAEPDAHTTRVLLQEPVDPTDHGVQEQVSCLHLGLRTQVPYLHLGLRSQGSCFRPGLRAYRESRGHRCHLCRRGSQAHRPSWICLHQSLDLQGYPQRD